MPNFTSFLSSLKQENPSFIEAVQNGYATTFNDNGIGGAGFFIVCVPKKTVLFGRRSKPDVHADHWCSFGGTTEPGEHPLQTAIREVGEEAGITEDMIRHHEPHLFVDENNGFKFQSFLGTCEDEFPVTLNDEHTEHGWFPLSKLPMPMHPGINRMLANPNVMRMILGSLND